MTSDNKIYTIDKVNKKILRRPPHVHSEDEYLGAENKYRDEDYEIYKTKRGQFYEAAKKYRELNTAALINTHNKLDFSCNDILRYYEECECDALPKARRCSDEKPNKSGLLLRKRTVRPIHKDNMEKIEVCCLEPWFSRYLKLCKFIYAARTVILHNRLLKNLEKLKQLTPESVAMFEEGHRKYENVSYAHIFDKFIK